MTFIVSMDNSAVATEANPLAGLVTVDANVEEYQGETYRLERREIASFYERRGYRVVWCWEVLSGHNQGIFGGKCGTKAEARKWARHTIRYANEQYGTVPARKTSKTTAQNA